jgi:hypothetical protein
MWERIGLPSLAVTSIGFLCFNMAMTGPADPSGKFTTPGVIDREPKWRNHPHLPP